MASGNCTKFSPVFRWITWITKLIVILNGLPYHKTIYHLNNEHRKSHFWMFPLCWSPLCYLEQKCFKLFINFFVKNIISLTKIILKITSQKVYWMGPTFRMCHWTKWNSAPSSWVRNNSRVRLQQTSAQIWFYPTRLKNLWLREKFFAAKNVPICTKAFYPSPPSPSQPRSWLTSVSGLTWTSIRKSSRA